MSTHLLSAARAPVLFISHGSPMFALEPGRLGPLLAAVGEQLGPALRAILVISPHWQTRELRVMSSATPATIHDFGGFPRALFALQYRTCGDPAVSEAAATLLREAGFNVLLDGERGLDHGAWVPLRYLSPQGTVPVLQVSLPLGIDTAGSLRLGAALAPLREQGVLIVGSGSLTHNLQEFAPGASAPARYVEEFTAWTRAAVMRRQSGDLVDYRRRAPHAQRAHPTEEHYLPLLIASGASDTGDAVEILDGGITDGVLSMDAYLWRSAAA
jgi:4,5-DOPA dioxygenase extradiol